MLENTAGEVVAYGELSRINAEKRSLFLSRIIVDSSRRNQGIGKIMLNGIIEYAVDKFDAHKMNLYVFSDNVNAIMLYAGLGFIKVPDTEYQVEYDLSIKTGSQMTCTLQ